MTVGQRTQRRISPQELTVRHCGLCSTSTVVSYSPGEKPGVWQRVLPASYDRQEFHIGTEPLQRQEDDQAEGRHHRGQVGGSGRS